MTRRAPGRRPVSVGFPPIVTPAARVLVLGSLPGRMSLERQQYYAQPRNAFWRIVEALFGIDHQLPYPERTTALAEHGIALWDVCHSAHRPGSLDASIDAASIVTNDFVSFFDAHPRVTRVFLNGATAASLFERRVVPALGPLAAGRSWHPLPSTSPAHAAMRFDAKLACWQVVAEALR